MFRTWIQERKHEKLRHIEWQPYFHSGAQNVWDNEQTSLDRCAAADIQGKLQIYLLPDSEELMTKSFILKKICGILEVYFFPKHIFKN